MHRCLKILETKEQKVYFTSDPHLWHQRSFVWEARGYKDYEDHAIQWINTVNNTVRPTDILFITGDFFLNTTEELCERTLSRIGCQNIHYIWGNHENPLWKIYNREVEKLWININDESLSHAIFIDKPEVYPFRYKNVIFLGDMAEVVINGHYFVLCHYPLSIWNHGAKGAKMLCGHSHYGFKSSQENSLEQKILDVGWDGHKKPLSVHEVLKIMDRKGILVVDHHGKDESE